MMTEAGKLRLVARRLDIPEDDYLLGGSAAMVLHGIDRELGDVDVFTTTEQWFALTKRFVTDVEKADPNDGWSNPIVRYFGYRIILPDGDDYHRFDPPILRYNMGDLNLKVDIFYSWKIRNHQTTTDLVHIWKKHRRIVDGLPTTSLEWLRDWKAEAGREKDQRDIALIDEYLEMVGK